MAANSLTIRVAPHPAAVVITVTGELDVASAAILRGAITRTLDERKRDVHLDLRRVTFVDAAGIQVLARAQAEAAIRGVHVEITEWGWALQRTPVWAAARAIMHDAPPVDA